MKYAGLLASARYVLKVVCERLGRYAGTSRDVWSKQRSLKQIVKSRSEMKDVNQSNNRNISY